MKIRSVSVMKTGGVFILLYLLVSSLSAECGVLKNKDEEVKTSLLDQFNNYVDQTIDIINSKNTALSSLPNHFKRGTWGYLMLAVDYSLKLYNGSTTGIHRLQRSGDASISYNKTTGNLTVSVSVVSQQVQASYAVEVKVYGLSHHGEVTSNLPGLNMTVGLSLSSANLEVSLDHISVATTQAPNVTFSSTNPVFDYFVPLISDLTAFSDMTIQDVAQSSIQATIDVLNSPRFGYY